MDLSILIPNYDENVVQLTQSLHRLASELHIDFEILICDQATSKAHFEANNALNDLPHVQYFKWHERLGRSANRNYLADQSTGTWLMFIDSDAEIISHDSLKRFWNAKHADSAICGTMYYTPEDPGAKFRLRWKYGRNREMRSPITRSRNPYHSFISFVFLIGRDSFNKVRFNEELIEYGHEDTLFGKQLQGALIRPMHIDVNILHNGLIPAEAFIDKVEQSIRSLKVLTEIGEVDEEYTIYRFYKKLKTLRLEGIAGRLFSRFRGRLLKNLTGPNPSLRQLDLYKLGYYCTLMSGPNASSSTTRS